MQRLKTRAEFLRVANQRRRWTTPGLVMQAASGEPNAPVRVGFTASKKVGNAVARNRAKRRLREVARLVMAEHARAGHDYVLIARETTGDRPWPDLLNDVRRALGGLKLWHGSVAGSGFAAPSRRGR